MFFLNDIIKFKRKKGSKNKIKKSNHDDFKNKIAASRKARTDVNTVLRTVGELSYWFGR